MSPSAQRLAAIKFPTQKPPKQIITSRPLNKKQSNLPVKETGQHRKSNSLQTGILNNRNYDSAPSTNVLMTGCYESYKEQPLAKIANYIDQLNANKIVQVHH